jgi:hypothetical protein
MPTSMVDAMNPGAVAFALNMAKIDAAKPQLQPQTAPSGSVPQVPKGN